MVVLNGRFDGRQIVLDAPIPHAIPANTPVRVVFEEPRAVSSLERIADLAKPGGLPADFAAQHEHYVKGTPRR